MGRGGSLANLFLSTTCLKPSNSFHRLPSHNPSPSKTKTKRHFSMPKASHDLSSSSLFSLTFCCHLPQNPSYWPFMPGKLNCFTEVRPTFHFCFFTPFYPLCLISPPVIHVLNFHSVSTVQLCSLVFYEAFLYPPEQSCCSSSVLPAELKKKKKERKT